MRIQDGSEDLQWVPGAREPAAQGVDVALDPRAVEAYRKLDEALSGIAALPLTTFSDRAALAMNVMSFQRGQRLESIRLEQLAELDGRPEALAARAGTVAKTFSVTVLHRSESAATADVEAARALRSGVSATEGGLPRLAAAFAAGAVSREHVDVAVAALKQIPSRFKEVAASTLGAAPEGEAPDARGADRIDAYLTEISQEHSPKSTKKLTGQLLARLDPTGRDRYDERAHERRGVVMGTDATGMVVGKFALDPANGIPFGNVLNVLSAPHPAREELDAFGNPVIVTDTRTASQRRADAFGQMARLTAAALPDLLDVDAPVPSGHRHPRTLTPRILVTATVEDLRDAAAGADVGAAGDPRTAGGPGTAGGLSTAEVSGHGPISRAHLVTTMCDAILQRVLLAPDGAVLNLGREVRTVTAKQKLALAARDGGCVIPGCPIPAEWTDAHHVQHWSHGGPSDLDNYALLCQAHHQQVHAGVYEIKMTDGIPWVRPPSSVDPRRRWIRNTFRDHLTHARDLGRKLRQAVALRDQDPPEAPPDEPPPDGDPPRDDPPRITPHH